MTARARRRPPQWLTWAFSWDLHVPQVWKRLTHAIYVRLGYRGLVLVAFGLMWILEGVAVLLRPDFDPNVRHTYLSLWFRFALWAVLGAFAVSLGLFRSRWCPLGFAALFAGPAERCLSYLWAFFATWDPFYSDLAGQYLILTFTILLFAAWPDPPDITAVR